MLASIATYGTQRIRHHRRLESAQASVLPTERKSSGRRAIGMSGLSGCTLHRVVLFYVMSWYAMSDYATLYHIMLCYDVLHEHILCNMA